MRRKNKEVMGAQMKWLIGGSLILIIVAALALNVPASTLLLVGISLLCPATMFFGMRGMQQGSDRCCHTEQKNSPEPGEEQGVRKAA
jgi:hypothetical protein